MYKFLAKNGTPIAFGLGVLGIFIFLIPVFSGLDGFNALSDEDRITSNIFNAGITLAIFLAIVCAIGMLLFGLYHVLTNLKGSMKGLIWVAAIAAIFFIAYATASAGGESADLTKAIEAFEVSEGSSKFISGAMTTAGALLGLTALAFIVSEIRNFFK